MKSRMLVALAAVFVIGLSPLAAWGAFSGPPRDNIGVTGCEAGGSASPAFPAVLVGSAPVSSVDYQTVRMSISIAETREAEAEGMMSVWEAQKLARDIYDLLAERWGLRVFSNIAAAEQAHMDALADILARQSALPSLQTTQVGVFEDPELNRLFAELLAQGCRSVEDAIDVGIIIEAMDMADLTNRLSQAGDDEIADVYRSLLRATWIHFGALDRLTA